MISERVRLLQVNKISCFMKIKKRNLNFLKWKWNFNISQIITVILMMKLLIFAWVILIIF